MNAFKRMLHYSCKVLFILILPMVFVSCAERRICTNKTGEHQGFFYTFWKDGGVACLTLGRSGEYATRYNLAGPKNLVVGKGWRKGSANATITYWPIRFNPGINSYLTLYGWSTDPLVEYYVVDNWGTNFTPPGSRSPSLGTVVTDGGTYRIYRTMREQQPSIRGRQTFSQFWSVRTERRPIQHAATITFGNHVKAWQALGMRLGHMEYQVIATEGFGSIGSTHIIVQQR